MKWQNLLLLLTLIVIFPQTASAQLDVPRNVALSATDTTITVEWDGDSDADGFFIYWGTSSGNLNQRAQVDDLLETFTITGLTPGTQYFVAVSALENSNESNKSDTVSVTTATDNTAPAIPSDLAITDIDGITENSFTIQWDENTEADLDHYNVSYGTASGAYDTVLVAQENQAGSFPVTGLQNATRYFAAVSAVDTSDNESGYSGELIVDTLPDVRPPFAPADISGELSGIREITVQITDGNENMADLAGHIIYFSNTENAFDNSVDIGPALSHVFDDLNSDDTWYFSAAAYDQSGNAGSRTPEISVEMEELSRFLNQEEFDGGCFIHSSSKASESGGTDNALLAFLITLLLILPALASASRRKSILVFLVSMAFLAASPARAEEDRLSSRRNAIGITGGYLIPGESEFEDFYGNDLFPVYAFYQRWLSPYFSLDLEGGYLKKNGSLRTVSGGTTRIDSEITVVPVSASIKLNYPIIPYVAGYLGLGPDYWYVNEESDVAIGTQGDVSEWVGGYHGKAGFMFYNGDEEFEGTGFMTEAVYSRVDRFGGNDTDIGGWTFRLGFFYRF